MIFMGSMVAPESIKVVFSAIETPHIRIAGAVRASMSFAIAWEPFEVTYGKSISRVSKKIRDGVVHGRYADGGILNNFPIDELNTTTENPAYAKPIGEDALGARVQHNPSSYGFSLTSSLKEFDESKTPMTNRFHIPITLQDANGIILIASANSFALAIKGKIAFFPLITPIV